MLKLSFVFYFLFFILSSCGGGSKSPPTQSSSTPSSNNSNTGTPANPVKTFADLCASTGVIFCDDFEQGIKNDWIRDGGDVQLKSGQAKSGEGANIVELLTYDSFTSSKLLYTFTNQNEVYVRYDVQYAADYDNSGGSHGPALGGSQSPPWGMMGNAGTPPTGSDYFVLNHEPLGTIGSGGEFSFYTYFFNMFGMWGNDFVSSLTPKPIIEKDKWYCIEFGLQLNTAGTNNADGKAYFWVDGTQHGNFDNFQWRTDAKLMANTFMLDSYNHFNKGAPPSTKPNRVRYDNVIISTQPVGCL